MGCCLTKKSRDNRPGKAGTGKESLLDDDRLSTQRGVSLTRNDGSYDNRVFNHSTSTSSYDTASIDLGTYEPPKGGYDGTEEIPSRRVVGKSLMKIPEVKNLDKRTWAQKRGHMMRNWKKRYFVICDGEIVYFEKCDQRTTAGINQKGKVHLMGASCSLKMNEDDDPILEVVGRHGEKDLLLKFDTMSETQDWYDIIYWTIYKWNVSSITSGDESSDITNWYSQQRDGFEDAYIDLEKGCQFNKHGYNLSGKMTSSLVVLQGVRDEMCLVWWTVVGKSDGSGSSQSKGKKTLQRRIPLDDIVDVIFGVYADEDVPMLSIRTQSHTLDLQIIDDAAADTFARCLSTVLVFLAIPLPPNVERVLPAEEAPVSRKSAAKAARKGSTLT